MKENMLFKNMIKNIVIAALVVFCVVVFFNTARCQDLPDAPQPQPQPQQQHPSTWHVIPDPVPSTHWYTYRTNWKTPPNYTNKQLLKSKLFWVMHGAMWTSMIVACRNPKSGEECGTESGAMAGVTVMDFLAVKYMSPAYNFGVPTYAVQHYIRADLK
jgi:hypothetical protein